MIETERLMLRITDEDDVAALQNCLNKREISDAIYFIPHPFTVEDAQQWVDQSLTGQQQKKEWFFSAFLKSQDSYIGSINIHERKMGVAEIGYWLDPTHWRKGYASEMLSAAVDYALETLEFPKIFSTVAQDNAVSQHLLEKHGFLRTGDIVVEGGRKSFYYERLAAAA